MKRLLTIAVSLVWTAGCGSPDYDSTEGSSTELDEVTSEERLAYIRAADVWRPSDIAAKDLLSGPPADDAFEVGEQVVCRFVEPKKRDEMNGKTPKFKCGGCDDGCTVDETIKVKYGRGPSDNGEVYGEVMSTRLLWSLGFEADRVYSVRVLCKNCPENPWEVYSSFTPNAGARADRRFDFAVIERKNDGEKIEATEDQGWSWDELPLVDPSAGGAPAAQLDALRLLAAFMYHADNKPENQRLICLPEAVTEEGTCTDPFLMIQDAGTSFGSTKFLGLGYRKAELGAWSGQTVWKDLNRCQARLSSMHELKNPIVSEAGRQFLADLMAQLSEDQIRDLFVASRIEERGEKIKVDGSERPVTVDDWVAVFLRKRDELSQPCGS